MRGGSRIPLGDGPPIAPDRAHELGDGLPEVVLGGERLDVFVAERVGHLFGLALGNAGRLEPAGVAQRVDRGG